MLASLVGAIGEELDPSSHHGDPMHQTPESPSTSSRGKTGLSVKLARKHRANSGPLSSFLARRRASSQARVQARAWVPPAPSIRAPCRSVPGDARGNRMPFERPVVLVSH
jgi:hypothetical protein